MESNKRDFLDLLLLADEQENMIDTYLDRGPLLVLYDDGLKSICVVTDEGNACYGLQSLATYEKFQGKGYGKILVGYIAGYDRDKGCAMTVGTDDIPWIVSFYERCGFSFSHRLENYFVDHYDKPMFEGDIPLKDKVCLGMNLGKV